MSLTKRFVLFQAAVLAVLLGATLLIIMIVARSGLRDLLTMQLQNGSEVLAEYSERELYADIVRLESLVSMRPFRQGANSGISLDVQEELPRLRAAIGSRLLVITDLEHGCTISSGEDPGDLVTRVEGIAKSVTDDYSVFYLGTDSGVFEVVLGRVKDEDGLPIGVIATCERLIDHDMSNHLKRLTGFDILVNFENRVVEQTNSPLMTSIGWDLNQLFSDSMSIDGVHSRDLAGHEILFLSVPHFNLTVTYVVSLDEKISPITRRTTTLLIFLIIVGGSLAVGASYLLTSRTIGQRIDGLVKATERISRDDLEFVVEPKSLDELGRLSSEIEAMRRNLVQIKWERDRAHEERLTSERLATVGQMATGIIHDFKNPMSIIRAAADLMKLKLGEDDRVADYCAKIGDQIDRMSELTRDTLEYARGTTRLHLEPTELHSYFNSINEYHLELYRRSGIGLKILGEHGITVSIDRQRFRRVIDNLLGNALEALKPGDLVTINWLFGLEVLSIAIEDNGPGIPDEIRDKLFEPFVSTGKATGTGLGLAIAKKIVNDHGADIEVGSVAGIGTSFIIRLPAQLVVTRQVEDSSEEEPELPVAAV
ncbi:MAG: PAS domain-containing sensor histidine kinase [Candidatus Zixiibacteriota bacterium]